MCHERMTTDTDSVTGNSKCEYMRSVNSREHPADNYSRWTVCFDKRVRPGARSGSFFPKLAGFWRKLLLEIGRQIPKLIQLTTLSTSIMTPSLLAVSLRESAV